MTAKDIKVSRDYENDVLHVLKIGTPLMNISNIIISENVTLRIIKETREVVGFIIDEFSLVCQEWKDQKEYELMEYFDEILDVLNDNCMRKLTQVATASFV